MSKQLTRTQANIIAFTEENMSDAPIFQTIHWNFPNSKLPLGGQQVTWIDIRGRQIDGIYHGSDLWCHADGKHTQGRFSVVAWRERQK